MDRMKGCGIESIINAGHALSVLKGISTVEDPVWIYLTSQSRWICLLLQDVYDRYLEQIQGGCA